MPSAALGAVDGLLADHDHRAEAVVQRDQPNCLRVRVAVRRELTSRRGAAELPGELVLAASYGRAYLLMAPLQAAIAAALALPRLRDQPLTSGRSAR